ncbi:MAG: DNA-binding response regulator [Chloroflexi bacterium HGW-Chloroflexi-10]|nr:MAG: DNA-binding response regulator [Chloroflexi bacterium HGW-Chloroflexi-10]
MATILLIEDERELARVLTSYLENAGHVVLYAARGDDGYMLWQQKKPDLVLLDLNLPGMDGLDVAKEIRRQAETPIIMVTARVEEIDKLIGLELGADDYVSKPFSPREVVARIKTVLRRSGSAQVKAQILRVSDLEIDLDGHLALRNGVSIELTPTEFNILVVLATQPGRVFSRMQLLQAVQPDAYAYEGYERTVDAHIKNLRHKLELNPKEPVYVETVFGVGYRFSKTG